MDFHNKNFNNFSRTVISENRSRDEIISLMNRLRKALKDRYQKMMKLRIRSAGISENEYSKIIWPKIEAALGAELKILNKEKDLYGHDMGYWGPPTNIIGIATSEIERLNRAGKNKAYVLNDIKYGLLEELFHAIDANLGITKKWRGAQGRPFGKERGDRQVDRMKKISKGWKGKNLKFYDEYYCRDDKELYAALKTIQAYLPLEKFNDEMGVKYIKRLCSMRKEAEKVGIKKWVKQIQKSGALSPDQRIVQLAGFGCIDCREGNEKAVYDNLQRLAKIEKSKIPKTVAIAESEEN